MKLIVNKKLVSISGGKDDDEGGFVEDTKYIFKCAFEEAREAYERYKNS